MSKSLRVLITGTNKGIGNDLVKIFYKNQQNVIIYATSRQTLETANQRWKKIDPSNQRIKSKYLNICSIDSIKILTDSLLTQGEKIDIVVHNAAVADNLKDQGKKIQELTQVQKCFETNLKGPIYLTQSILPLLSDNCIVVNTSSMLGGLKFQPKYAQDKFTNPKITREEIFASIEEYNQGVRDNNLKDYNLSAYATSKMMLQAWSRFILQRTMLKLSQKSICVSPGFCRTPMTEDFLVNSPAHTSQSGAEKIYETIFLPDLDPDVFYHRGRKSDFYYNGHGLPF